MAGQERVRRGMSRRERGGGGERNNGKKERELFN